LNGGKQPFASNTSSVAVVGSRKPSADGIIRARRMAKLLVESRFTVVSGLAEGIDTAVHTAVIESGGNTIAVIGTSIGAVYPRANRDLQEELANKHLLISQVPILRYEHQTWRVNRLFFPERNKTMSALTRGTIIVEAGETSGTLTQARAALQQGRKLFILDSLLQRSDLTWPRQFIERGAIHVREFDDVLEHLGPPNPR
jgi:DNA processing protein